MVNNTKNKHGHFLVAVLFLWVTSTLAFGGVVLENEGIIGERAVTKMEIMGGELKQRTGVNAYVSAVESLKGQNIAQYEAALAATLPSPYILLALSKEDHQVDIIASQDVIKRFDKEGVLSPWPWSGTIIPLLSSKKGEDKYSAAMLNGYADVVEQVAASYGVELESAIGSANKSVMGLEFLFMARLC